MGKQTKHMKQLGLSNKAGPNKRRKQQQPPLHTTSASSTHSPALSSCSAVILDNADLLGLVASFLRFETRAGVERGKTLACCVASPFLRTGRIPASTSLCSASRSAVAALTRC